jgi:hypothetical protein
MKQPTKRLTLADVANSAPPVVLSAEPTDEELKQAIRWRVVNVAKKPANEKWSREDWQLMQAFWDRVEPKNRDSEEDKLSAADAKHIADAYSDLFGKTTCPKCHHVFTKAEVQ